MTQISTGSRQPAFGPLPGRSSYAGLAQEATPIARIIGAALDLAWLESAGEPMDPEEQRVLSLCDDLWHVRADVADQGFPRAADRPGA